MTTTTIERAAQLDEEINFLVELCGDLTNDELFSVYADWLED